MAITQRRQIGGRTADAKVNRRMSSMLNKSKGGDFSSYMTQLDELLKRNKGQGVFAGQDVAPSFKIQQGRNIVNPGGVDTSGAIQQLSDVSQTRTPQRQLKTLGAMPQEFKSQGYGDIPMPDNQGWQRQESQYGGTQGASSEQQQQVFEQTGQVYPIASQADGGTLYNDGSIRYQDNTIRFGEPGAYAIANQADGSILYSDGSVKQSANMVNQSIAPAQPQQQTTEKGVINFFDKFEQGYKYNASTNSMIGECAWFAQQIATLPGGRGWPVKNLIQDKKQKFEEYRAQGDAFRPGEDEAKLGNSIIFDLGTRYGHVAVISEIFIGEDGKKYYRLTEANMPGYEKSVDHTRVVPADDPKIVGYMRTVPNENLNFSKVSYEEAPPIDGTRADIQNTNVGDAPQDAVGGETMPEVEAEPVMSRPDSVPVNQSFEPQQQMPTPMTDMVTGAVNAGRDLTQSITQPLIKAVQTPQIQGMARAGGELIAPTIDKLKPTGEFDLGITEGLVTPEATKARFEGAKASQPSRGLFGKARQTLGNLTEAIGDYAGVPESGFSEALAGGATRRTNQVQASEIDEAQKVNQSTQPNESLGIKDFLANGVDKLRTTSSDILGGTAKGIGDITDLQSAGQGVEALKGGSLLGSNIGQGAIAASMGGANIFRKPSGADITDERSIGDVSGVGAESLLPTDRQGQKKDVRDEFFKSGDAAKYGEYIKDLDTGGAFSMNLFKPEFFQDAGRIKNIFGGRAEEGQAAAKFGEYQARLAREAEEKRRRDAEDRKRKPGEAMAEWMKRSGQQSTLDTQNTREYGEARRKEAEAARSYYARTASGGGGGASTGSGAARGAVGGSFAGARQGSSAARGAVGGGFVGRVSGPSGVGRGAWGGGYVGRA